MDHELPVVLGRPFSVWEQAAHDSMVEFGTDLGASYDRVWDDIETIVDILSGAIATETDSVMANRPKFALSDGAQVLRWVVSGAGFMAFVAMFQLEPFSAGGWIAFLLWVGCTVGFGWLIARGAAPEEQYKKDGELLTSIFREAAMDRATEGVVRRRVEAQMYTPGSSSSGPFEPMGPMPLPQQYGVSHEGAERLVAEWMRYFGEQDAEVTRYAGDGGIDVQSLHYIAQVKNYTGAVQVAEVRELGGVASVDGRKPLFFTSGTYSAGALDFANRSGIALFRYDAIAGSLHDENPLARIVFQDGL